MKKVQKLLMSVAALALVGTCGLALTACDDSAAPITAKKSYSMTINSWSDYTDEHEVPFLTGQSGAIFGFDSWIVSGTKVNFDDDGNPIDCYWTFNLEVEDSIVKNHVDYVMTYYFHGGASELYDNPIDAVYKFYGLGYEIKGGYHLYVANFAEAAITLNCAVETPGWPENGDTGEGEGVFSRLEGPNGMIYYHYCNSDIQAAGGHYGFPFQANLTQGFSECDVLVSGSKISGFDNVTGNKAVVVEGGSSSSGGPGGELPGGPGGPGEEEPAAPSYIYENEMWAGSATVEALAGAYTYSETVAGMMAGENFAWNVEFTFEEEGGKVTAHATSDEVQFGPKDLTFEGTYKVYHNNDETLIIISDLGVLKTGESVPGGKTEGAAPSEYNFKLTNASGNTILKLTGTTLSLLEVK